MKMIKTHKILALTVAAALFLVSCRADINTVSVYSPRQIADAIISAQADIADLRPLNPEDDYFEHYLTSIYKLEAETVKDGIIYYSGDGMLADEIAVFLLDGEADMQETQAALLNYISLRDVSVG